MSTPFHPILPRQGADEIDAEALEEETVEAANKGSRRRAGEGDQDDAEAVASAAAEAAAKEALAVKRRALRQDKRKLTIEKRLPKVNFRLVFV